MVQHEWTWWTLYQVKSAFQERTNIDRFYWNEVPRVAGFIETESRRVITGTGKGERGVVAEWVEFQFCQKKSWFVCTKKLDWKVEVAQSCLTLCYPMDYVHGILQARILEWVTLPFSRESCQPRDWTQVSCVEGRFFTSSAIREALRDWSSHLKWLN